ncbi:MAG: hypothetical protein AB8H79_16215 [Myxococcota bacterium]
MRAFVAHMRPAAMVPTFLSALTGYALSPARASGWALAADFATLFVLHSVLLWGGTNAWNSACDGDSGPLTLLPNPPPIPRHLGSFGLVLMLGAAAMGLAIYGPLGLTVIGAVALSLLYSTPTPWWPRGKAVPGIDMAINAAGSGLISIMIGWGITGAPFDTGLWVAGGAFSLAYFAGIPTTQIFQLTPESKDWASWVGPRRVLLLGAGLFAAHLLLLASFDLPPTPLSRGLWWLWLALTAATITHLIVWARRPMNRPYPRMLRQLVLAMSAQVAWTAAVW